jgi:hypothetical protein
MPFQFAYPDGPGAFTDDHEVASIPDGRAENIAHEAGVTDILEPLVREKDAAEFPQLGSNASAAAK